MRIGGRPMSRCECMEDSRAGKPERGFGCDQGVGGQFDGHQNSLQFGTGLRKFQTFEPVRLMICVGWLKMFEPAGPNSSGDLMQVALTGRQKRPLSNSINKMVKKKNIPHRPTRVSLTLGRIVCRYKHDLKGKTQGTS